MRLPFFIAFRYLFAKKSHNVINIVSAISAVGMAVGTAALVIILSVYNGFDSIVKGMFSTVEPDLMVVTAQGKYFEMEDEAFDWAYDNPDVASMCPVLQENVFVSYEGNQGTATVKGVDQVYMEESALNDYVTDGTFVLGEDSDNRSYAAVGRGLARELGINLRFLSPVVIYYPSTNARFSVINPMAGVASRKLFPACEFSVNAEIDNNLMLVDRKIVASLLGVGSKVSAVEIRLVPGIEKSRAKAVEKGLSQRLGPDFKVLDRARQNPSLYKMLRYEKAAVYMIMLFVVLILGFCIFGGMSMLIIDKEPDMQIMRAMGMEGRVIRRVFTLEGWLITLLGMAAGLVVALVLCTLQQRFGFVGMPDNFMVDAYPVILQWQDVALSAGGIAICGYLISRAASSRIIG